MQAQEAEQGRRLIAGDGRLGTFNPLFPRAKYFGELTPVGPLNLMNLHPSVDLTLSDEFSLSASAIAYWRMSLEDGVYDLSGNRLRSGAESRSRYIGTQGELVLSYAAGRTVEGLGRFSIAPPPLDMGRFTMSLMWHARRQDDPRHVWLRRAIVDAAAGINART